METVMYLSGMFAGGWIWDRVKIPAANHVIVEEALCEIGDNLDAVISDLRQRVISAPGRVTLVSNSLGAYVAMHLAILEPMKVERIVLSGSAGFEDVKLPVPPNRKEPEKMAEALLELIFFDKSKIERPYADIVVDCFKDNFMSILRLMKDSNKNADAASIIHRVPCDVLAVWGDHDVITPIAPALGALISAGVEIALIKDCGHSPMCEKPLAFSDAVLGCDNLDVERLQLLPQRRVVNA